jgi:hypothetical protein
MAAPSSFFSLHGLVRLALLLVVLVSSLVATEKLYLSTSFFPSISVLRETTHTDGQKHIKNQTITSHNNTGSNSLPLDLSIIAQSTGTASVDLSISNLNSTIEKQKPTKLRAPTKTPTAAPTSTPLRPVKSAVRDSHPKSASNLNSTSQDPCRGKKRLLQIVLTTGIDLSTNATKRREICNALPLWSDVVALYGDAPVLLGLERCQEYRDMILSYNKIMNGTAVAYPMPRVAGLQNTGTTAFADTLFLNLKPNPTIRSDHPRVYNVPWRKHMEVRYRKTIVNPYVRQLLFVC